MRKFRRKRSSKKLLGGGNLFYRLGAFLLNLVVWDITSENSKIRFLIGNIINKRRIDNHSENIVRIDEESINVEFIENKN